MPLDRSIANPSVLRQDDLASLSRLSEPYLIGGPLRKCFIMGDNGHAGFPECLGDNVHSE
jgi:hypothetical protein